MPPVNVPIRWEVATDPHMRRIVSRGTVLATPELDHSVRVVVEGLQSDTWYCFYLCFHFQKIGFCKSMLFREVYP